MVFDMVAAESFSARTAGAGHGSSADRIPASFVLLISRCFESRHVSAFQGLCYGCDTKRTIRMPFVNFPQKALTSLPAAYTERMKKFLKDALGWGFILWLIGYFLGIVLFAIVPPSLLGWVIMPIGIAVTLWALFKKVAGGSLGYYALVGLVWAIIAIVCDYVFLVQVFHPADGYYKLDIYLYYALTFALPVMFGWWKQRHQGSPSPV